MNKRTKTYAASALLEVRSPVLKAINYIFLILAVLIILVPLTIVFLMSFKSNQEYMYSGIFDLPQSFFNFENYKIFIEQGKLFLSFRNVILICIVSVTGSILMAAMVSYVINRFDFKLKNILLGMFVVAMIIPSITTEVARFTVIQKLGIYNTLYAGMILFLTTNMTQIYIFLQFMGKIPKELDESAKIDGASLYQVFFRIIMPQLKPAIVTTIILKTLGIYNDMFIPYMYMPKNSLRVVTQSIRLFTTEQGGRWNVISAGVVAVMLPTLILYLFAQKYIIAGVTDGAVKG